MVRAPSPLSVCARLTCRVMLCAAVAMLTLSLAGGWAFRAIESGSVPMLRTKLRPVRAPEVMPLGYVYRAGSSPCASAELLRRHTGLEPRIVQTMSWCGTCAQGTVTEVAFYEGRTTNAVGPLINTAAGRGVESYAVTEIGWPLPVWRHTLELSAAGPLRTNGTLHLGPVWLATRPAWPGFILWAALLGIGVSALWRALQRLRSLRIPAGYCQQCRYDLSGLAAGLCPECGHSGPPHPSRLRQRSRDPRRLALDQPHDQ